MTDYDDYHNEECVNNCSHIWDYCYFFCCYCCIMFKKHQREYDN